VFNCVMAFSNANQAHAAWTAGINLCAPAQLQSQYDATIGRSTGLGDNALKVVGRM
jgi:hypothetical protein